jgi:hypothetical protein
VIQAVSIYHAEAVPLDIVQAFFDVDDLVLEGCASLGQRLV